MKTKILIVVFLTSLIVGCGGSRFKGWVRPDTTEQQMLTDRYECEKECYAAGADWSMFNRCMESKGYRQPGKSSDTGERRWWLWPFN
jgi:hypothetical protein